MLVAAAAVSRGVAPGFIQTPCFKSTFEADTEVVGMHSLSGLQAQLGRPDRQAGQTLA
jgi:hypothetical protein